MISIKISLDNRPKIIKIFTFIIRTTLLLTILCLIAENLIIDHHQNKAMLEGENLRSDFVLFALLTITVETFIVIGYTIIVMRIHKLRFPILIYSLLAIFAVLPNILIATYWMAIAGKDIINLIK